MTAPAILHVTSLLGGGVDRHVRDIARGVARPQLVWHAGDGADVIEDPRARRFFPLARDAVGEALARWLRGRRVGLVHLHQLASAPRERAEWACRALSAPRVTTLHDILFLRPDAFAAPDPLAPDPAWLAGTSRVLRESAAVLAPSRWLADLARAHVPGLAPEVIPNGSRAAEEGGTTAAPAPGIAGRVVALLGAIGPHKGGDLVHEVARRLEGTDIVLVVIGYLENRFHPGWEIPGRLYVHGAFPESEAGALLRAYGARLVLMPGRVPESFSYALSDAWSAGVPVLAAPAGALAERIGAHGGGWLLPEGFDAAAVASAIRELAGGAREAERARVQSLLARPDPARIPPLDAMTRSLDALYARFGIDPAAPADAGDARIQALLAANLDGALFRPELARLAEELAQATAALEATRARGEAFEAEARGWIAKLEADVRALQEALRRAGAERDALATEADRLRLAQEALDRLPSPVKRLLLKLAFDARR
jgi:glycosyltransferase involved in cell wall biosynthesis